MAMFASALFKSMGAWRAGLAAAIVLALPGQPAAAERVKIPTCEQFAAFGRNWVGLDEDRASRDLGLPLYELTNADIDLISQAIRRCQAAAATPPDKAVFADLLTHVRSLTAARDRVVRAFSDFEAAKKKAAPKFQAITAKLKSLQATPANRAAVDDAQAEISRLYFGLEEKRNHAQVRETLAESFKPYADTLGALARKRQELAESARLALIAAAEEAVGARRAEFEHLNVPEVSQDATIILEGADVGADVRWLTLRQWASFVLKNTGVDSLSVMRDADADPRLVAFKIVRPGYGDVIVTFQQDGRELHVVRTEVDGVVRKIATPADREQTIALLISVAKPR